METVHETPDLRFERLVAGPLENNVWIVSCRASGAAVIVDAADEAPAILRAVEGKRVSMVLTTHSHADHHGAAAPVCEALEIPFRIHPLDAPAAGITPWDPVSGGEEIAVGSGTLRAVHTPGHTPGSVCFTTPGVLLSGDTLFPGGPGATATPADFEEIMGSLDQHLFTLPDETVVLPGHGAATTIGRERPSLPEWRRRGW